MREAFGGTFTIQLILVFLAIYIAFIAVALNYAKAFRVKNQIINLIEQNEGIDNTEWTDQSGVIGKINTYLGQMSYYVDLNKISNNNNDNLHCYEKGYCIEEYSLNSTDEINSVYYKVTTYVKIDLQVFRLNFTIPITGETRKIERIAN